MKATHAIQQPLTKLAFGELLEALRERKCLTLAQLAESCDANAQVPISTQRIRTLENGDDEPTTQELVDLAYGLRMDLDQFEALAQVTLIADPLDLAALVDVERRLLTSAESRAAFLPPPTNAGGTSFEQSDAPRASREAAGPDSLNA